MWRHFMRFYIAPAAFGIIFQLATYGVKGIADSYIHVT